MYGALVLDRCQVFIVSCGLLTPTVGASQKHHFIKDHGFVMHDAELALE